MSIEVDTFAGGCVWCMVEPCDQRPGIGEGVAGSTGCDTPPRTYEQMYTNTTGHLEAVQITSDPDLMSFEELLQLFWQQIDPTDPGGQSHDRGESYQTAIFYHHEEPQEIAERSN